MIVKAEVQIGGVLLAMGRLLRINLKPALVKLRKPMHADQRDHRDRQMGPIGAWKPLAATTLARYAREGKRRNRRILARLPNSRYAIITADELIMRSRVKWSMAHFDGPTIVGHGSVLPQRQFFWISDAMIRTAQKELTHAMWCAFFGIKYP